MHRTARALMAASGGVGTGMADIDGGLLVSAQWLAERLRAAATTQRRRVVPVDASWHMPASKRSARVEFHSVARIPHSRRFDIDAICAPADELKLPHMLPTMPVFARAMDALDIRNDDHVVVYDHSDVYSAFRVWWTLRVFGHSGPVSVLDGGLAHWMAEGHETVVIAPSVSNSNSLESDANSLREATVEAPAYKSDWQSGRYRRFEDMVKNVRLRTWQVADARSEERFHGRVPEPRAGIASGHIPGSVNVPFTELLNAGTGLPGSRRLKSVEDLRAVFRGRDIDLGQPLVCSCGSGVTASTVAFAAELCGAADVSVYDGSWTEYALLRQILREDDPAV